MVPKEARGQVSILLNRQGRNITIKNHNGDVVLQVRGLPQRNFSEFWVLDVPQDIKAGYSVEEVGTNNVWQVVSFREDPGCFIIILK